MKSIKNLLLTVACGTSLLLTPLMGNPANAQSKIQIPMGVEFTPQQEAQFTQIRLQTRNQIQNILTEQQREEFKAAIARGEGVRKAIANLNLSPEQKTQLQELFKSVHTQVANTLTPEQKQQIRQNLRSRFLQGNNRQLPIFPGQE
ncbi:hypothetical protein [Calothrix sp. 336/3]|uniref:hypothetical protein n=1 Tax=Calothrix sp. 336/3 TaxID=1337936 RepID=UPI00069AC8FB|nr:hypothetical protein [Calothrix sp. 336/3]